MKNPHKNPNLPAHLTPGNPGNSGGKKGRSGRPRSVIRAACAMAFDQRIKFLKAVVDGKAEAGVAERLKALDMLAKYGLGTTSTATDTEGNDVPRPGKLTDEEIHAELQRLAREPD